MTAHTSWKRPFREHLEELRLRLLVCVLTLFLASGVGFFIYPQLVTLLLLPLHQSLYYSSPLGGVNFVFKICLFFGCLISLPLFLYNLLKFVEPIFSVSTRILIWKVLLFSFILMGLGMSFGYFINLPIVLHVLSRFSTPQIHALLSTDQYLTFVTTDLFGFAVIFQMPLIFLFINTLEKLSLSWFLKQEKYIIVGSFLLGAILTPDPLNQIIMALPIIFLYQLSMGLVFLQNTSKLPL